MPPAIVGSEHFSQGDRVRLWYVVTALLPENGDTTLDLNDCGMYWLEDHLKFKLGRLNIAGGFTEQNRIQRFIVSAPETELLDLIEFVPVARMAAHREHVKARGPYARNYQDEIHRLSCEELNTFLTTTTSPARFDQNGTFRRDQFVVEVPIALSKLPGKEHLRRDMQARCADAFPTALLFIDLDNFKQVNDTQSHQAGDTCLGKVAEVLGTISSMRGKVYRWGGDEFAIILPNCTTGEAEPAAERVRSAIEEASVGGTINVTVSIGIAGTDRIGNVPEHLMSAADQAMYEAKKYGRNRFMSAEASRSGTNP